MATVSSKTPRSRGGRRGFFNAVLALAFVFVCVGSYRAIRGRDADLNDLMSQLQEFEETNERLAKQVEKLKLEIPGADQKKKLDDVTKQLGEAKAQLADLPKVREELAKLKSEKQTCDTDLGNARNHIADLKNYAEGVNQKVADLTASLTECQNDLKSVELAAANAIKKEAAKDPNKPQEGQQQQQAAAAQQ